ncbi:hyaluronate lyase N-terminal domain-containing protein [Mycobacterium sp. BMJ-28]
MSKNYRFQPRRATAAEAAENDGVLLMGEKGFETDTRRWKTGDGSTHWNDLPYDDEPGNLDGATETGVAVLTGDAPAGREALGALPGIVVDSTGATSTTVRTRVVLDEFGEIDDILSEEI